MRNASISKTNAIFEFYDPKITSVPIFVIFGLRLIWKWQYNINQELHIGLLILLRGLVVVRPCSREVLGMYNEYEYCCPMRKRIKYGPPTSPTFSYFLVILQNSPHFLISYFSFLSLLVPQQPSSFRKWLQPWMIISAFSHFPQSRF